MKSLVLKNGILVFLIIVIPSTVFTVLEFGSLNQQESLIEKIYERQLKSVLFSINMYADDIVNTWVSKASIIVEEDENTDTLFNNFVNENPQIEGVALKRMDDQETLKYYGYVPEVERIEFDDLLIENQTSVNQLFVYLKSNYRKILVLDFNKINNSNVFVFAVKSRNKKNYLCGITIRAEQFINDVLAPRIQAIAGEEFVIGVKHRAENRVVYSTTNEASFDNASLNEVFWQLPDYSVYMNPKGFTMKEVVMKRARVNLWLIFGVDTLLILGGIFVYRSVKKQIHLAKIKSDFVSNVSHEIRTPLSLISMYAESLKLNRVTDDEKRQKSYRIIYREANRLTGIVNNILNFSKIDNGKRNYQFKSMQINQCIKSVVDNYQFQMEYHNVEVKCLLFENVPDIEGDKEALSETLVNLIDNAIKYSNEEKKIEIRSGISGKHVWVEVKDNGIGIPEKEQKLIFQKFYRVTYGNLAYHAKGSGIGLNIVKSIVEAHHGYIDLISQPGVGSRFIIYLPINNP